MKNYSVAMCRLWMILLLLASLASAHASGTVHGRVYKVLPLLLDQQGRDAVSPSLFDRDAYQFFLRQHTNEISTVRFDVWWKAPKSAPALKLRAEFRGIGERGLPTRLTLEQPVTAHRFSQWNSILLTRTNYEAIGALVAWRVTLWNGDALLDEQKSFLW